LEENAGGNHVGNADNGHVVDKIEENSFAPPTGRDPLNFTFTLPVQFHQN
jgi:hypothetical protein